MRNIMLKEMKLSAAPITYLFISFGLMFLIPGYPILCGAFFTGLGIYQGFQYVREANDIVFSALLPIAKKDVVKGKFYFVCFIELCSFALMLVATLFRMTVLSEARVYRANFMMNANFFALGAALMIFGIFNLLFLGGFFKNAYNTGKPFIIHMIATFLVITVMEALHHVPGLEKLNAFAFDHFGLQFFLLVIGLVIGGLLTYLSYKTSCRNFEKVDL